MSKFKKNHLYTIDSFNYVYVGTTYDLYRVKHHDFVPYPSCVGSVVFPFRCKSLRESKPYNPFVVGKFYDFGTNFPGGLYVYNGLNEDDCADVLHCFVKTVMPHYRTYISIRNWQKMREVKDFNCDVGL